MIKVVLDYMVPVAALTDLTIDEISQRCSDLFFLKWVWSTFFLTVMKFVVFLLLKMELQAMESIP